MNFLEYFSKEVEHIARNIGKWKLPDDLVLVSIHWGSNWGYDIPSEHRDFAHSLLEFAHVDITDPLRMRRFHQ